MYNEDDYLLLSGIQHYAFCRRQWALIHIEGLWCENALTAEGQVQHARVHDRALSESRGGELIIRGMQIKSASLGASGECDAVVFTQAEDGVPLQGRKGKWSVLPVEYKHGRQKTSDCDRLQAAAQAMCLEEMLCCNIPRAALYYAQTKNREYVEITDELRVRVCRLFAEMHDCFRRGYTPRVKPHGGCKSCSLREECLPSLMKRKETAAQYIQRRLQEEDG